MVKKQVNLCNVPNKPSKLIRHLYKNTKDLLTFAVDCFNVKTTTEHEVDDIPET